MSSYLALYERIDGLWSSCSGGWVWQGRQGGNRQKPWSVHLMFEMDPISSDCRCHDNLGQCEGRTRAWAHCLESHFLPSVYFYKLHLFDLNAKISGDEWGGERNAGWLIHFLPKNRCILSTRSKHFCEAEGGGSLAVRQGWRWVGAAVWASPQL